MTAEYGSDLSLSCTFYSDNNDENVSIRSSFGDHPLFESFSLKIVQWLYQNVTEKLPRGSKSHWRPLFLNTQALTTRETRYSIQQKIQSTNQSSQAYSTILTLAKINDSDEGLYMCKSLSPPTMQMTYQVRVIREYLAEEQYRMHCLDISRELGYSSETVGHSY